MFSYEIETIAATTEVLGRRGFVLPSSDAAKYQHGSNNPVDLGMCVEPWRL